MQRTTGWWCYAILIERYNFWRNFLGITANLFDARLSVYIKKKCLDVEIWAATYKSTSFYQTAFFYNYSHPRGYEICGRWNFAWSMDGQMVFGEGGTESTVAPKRHRHTSTGKCSSCSTSSCRFRWMISVDNTWGQRGGRRGTTMWLKKIICGLDSGGKNWTIREIILDLQLMRKRATTGRPRR